MTWNEFKAAVDEKLAEQGADGSQVRIWYADLTDVAPDTPTYALKVRVHEGELDLLTIDVSL